MVTLEQIRASNAQIATALPPGLVAVFAGATSGIGEAALKRFAKQAVKPRVYFLGRSKEAGDRIAAELRKLNSGGQYSFISVDVSSLKAVDDACRQIKENESAINLLFMSTGTMLTGKDTAEGLYYTSAVSHYARFRFIVNLLPLLQNATSLRRVVSVLSGSKEGKVNTADFPCRTMHLLSPKGMAHLGGMMTLGLERLAQQAPTVSFVHTFPGFVKTNLGNDVKGAGMAVARGIWNALFPVIGSMVTTSLDETGERQTFFATSAMFPPATDPGALGVPLARGLKPAQGSDGKSGSGVYSLTKDGEHGPAKIAALLADQRSAGVGQEVWKHVEEEFVRVTGAASA